MFGTLLTVECIIYDKHSLKEKRAVLQRIIVRTRQKYNVSIAEVDHQDVWQRTKLAIAFVSSSKKICEQTMQDILDFLDSFPEIERTITELEWI